MLGNYFYNERIRKAVAVFGSLFNDIYVQRKNASGGVLSQIKVPLSYAPKRDFIDRIAQTNDGHVLLESKFFQPGETPTQHQ